MVEPRLSPSGGRRYVLIASNAYSGSTLLSYLLAAHPEVATVSDVSGTRRKGQMDEFRCSCRQRMRECPFWLAVELELRSRGVEDFDLEDFHLGFDDARTPLLRHVQARSMRWTWLEDVRDLALRPTGSARRMADIGRRNWIFAQAVMDIEHASIFVDASKERMRIRHLERHLPTDLYVIHLVRDVRGVVDSTARRNKMPLSAAQMARRWAKTNGAILRQLRDVPDERQLRIRYEDLCLDVSTSMRTAFSFCGVDPDRATAPLSAGTHLLGNRMRLTAQEEVRLDESWRTRLTPESQLQIMTAAAPVFSSLYPERWARKADGHAA